MPNGGKIKIKVKVIEDNTMNISIRMKAAELMRKALINLGEPFYTTKKDGTGLGLMVTNQIIKDHNGDIRFRK